MRFFLIILTLIFLNNCSFDKNSNFWLEKNKDNNNKKTKGKIFSEFENPMVFTIEEFKIYLNEYANKNKYPNIK